MMSIYCLFNDSPLTLWNNNLVQSSPSLENENPYQQKRKKTGSLGQAHVRR